MEVHVELHTATKMFCPCPTTFGAEPNTKVCRVPGMPGALPVVNRPPSSRRSASASRLNCSITRGAVRRKNYSTRTSRRNYQISQYDEPIATEGYLDVVLDDGSTWRVDIERAHMEEDTESRCTWAAPTVVSTRASHSLLDYNRAGVPLVEIVTKPITGAGERAPEVARAYVAALRDLLKALDVSDVRMDQGSLRATRTSRSCRSAPTCSAPARRPRTSTRSRASRRPFATRCAVRPPFCSRWRSHPGDRHFQEGDGTTSAGRRKETAEDYRLLPGARSRARRTGRRVGRGVAWHVARAAVAPPCPHPGGVRASPTRRCATSSTPVPSTSSSRPTRQAHPRPRPRSGGWHTSRRRPNNSAVSS